MEEPYKLGDKLKCIKLEGGDDSRWNVGKTFIVHDIMLDENNTTGHHIYWAYTNPIGLLHSQVELVEPRTLHKRYKLWKKRGREQ